MKDKKPIITFILVGINVLIFLIESAYGSPESTEVAFKFGAQTTDSILQSGQWYRLFTAMFIHFGFEHLMGNMIALIAIGQYAEDYFGKIKYTIIYFVSGICGNLLTLLVEMHSSTASVSAGASGAISGILATLVIFALDKKTRQMFPIPRVIVGIILILVPGLLEPEVNFIAHIGGFVAGLILSYTFYYFKECMKPAR